MSFYSHPEATCTEDGCTNPVQCSDRAWEAGVRKCRTHWTQDGGWTAGPVCLDEFVAMLGQYEPRDTWNGWLCPQIDPVGVEALRAAFATVYDEDQFYTYEWQDDLSLVVTWHDGDEEAQEDILNPDEDGLYDFGRLGWTWSEDLHYGATEEWQDWAHRGTRVSIDAHNAKNSELHALGGDAHRERYSETEAAGQAAYDAWLVENPEPLKYDPEQDYDDGKARPDYARSLVDALAERGVTAEIDHNTGGGCRAVRAAWLLITDGDADLPTRSYGVALTDTTSDNRIDWEPDTDPATVADAIADILGN